MNKNIIIAVIALVIVGGVAAYGFLGSDSGSDVTDTSNMVSDTSMMKDDKADAMKDESPSQTIVEIAASNENFETLVAAVQAAGLVETLSSEGPFTVFAPTDEAFAKLPEGTVESLLDDPEALANILTYHVVAGKVMAADVVELREATTVQGDTVSIEVTDQGVMVNDALVTTTDIEASNGVIHVIDTVLLPN